MTELSAAELARCATGDMNALRRAYDCYGDRVYRTALHVLIDPAEAEDATQDVFLKLLDTARSFDGRSKVSTWLYRMTVNHCLNILKRRRRGPRALPDDAGEHLAAGEEDSPLRQAEVSDAGAQVRRHLARLTERDRTILVLREIEELSYREIAETLDVPEGTVMSRLARARERFAASVEAAAKPIEFETQENPR